MYNDCNQVIELVIINCIVSLKSLLYLDLEEKTMIVPQWADVAPLEIALGG
jgi:hypothetical protein